MEGLLPASITSPSKLSRAGPTLSTSYVHEVAARVDASRHRCIPSLLCDLTNDGNSYRSQDCRIKMWAPATSKTMTASTNMPSLRFRRDSRQERSDRAQHWEDVAARSEEIRQIKLEEADASLPSMFQRLRRNSKQMFHPSASRRKNSTVNDISATPEEDYLRLGRGRLTFFDLPAEIRNVIYQDVASETKIYVPVRAARRDPSKAPPLPTPSLLLVSRQTRNEYLPLLLEYSTLSFAIRDFGFQSIIRVSASLYSSELKALRKNPDLTVRLLATKTSDKGITDLRRWLQNRTEGMHIFPLTYSIVWPKATQILPTSTQVHRINTYLRRRSILIQNLEAMCGGQEGKGGLYSVVPEALQFELQPLIDLFQRELDGLHGAIDDGGRAGGEAFGLRTGSMIVG